MGVLSIGQYDLPKIAKMSVMLQDLDSKETGRNQSGYMFRDRVRGGATSPRKLSVEFLPMSNTEMSTLLQQIGLASFQLTYPDPYTGGNRTSTFYCGDRPVPVLDCTDGTPRWSGFTVSLVEF